MSTLRVIADDVTGACDVGGEFAAAGYAVRVSVDDCGSAPPPGELEVTNTQSRSLSAAEAAGRVRAAVGREQQSGLLFKKIDTALRGHLGAELEAAVEASGARGAFIVPAIPAVGRVTRDGRQWVGGQLLGTTEFARDPEGRGAESSVAAVLAYESDWPCDVIDLDAVRTRRLEAEAHRLLDTGGRFIVVDAETDADVEAAVSSVLALPGPVCLAGSVPLAGALARRDELAVGPRGAAVVPTLRPPTLVVCGSLHSRAHAQTAALVAADVAEREVVDGRAPRVLTARVRALLDGGRNVILESPPIDGAPPLAALRGIEDTLGEIVQGAAAAGPIGSLVLIGGETSYAVLRRLGASELIVRGRPAPLVAVAEIATGVGAGTLLVTKGGSGGDVDALTTLVVNGTVR